MKTIGIKIIPEAGRLAILPKKFGGQFLNFEMAVYDIAGRSPDYNGGYWDYMIAENGAFYMRPDSDSKFRFDNVAAYYEGVLSPDAFGVVCTLYACSLLAFDATGSDQGKLVDNFHLLRQVAVEHLEASDILTAID